MQLIHEKQSPRACTFIYFEKQQNNELASVSRVALCHTHFSRVSPQALPQASNTRRRLVLSMLHGGDLKRTALTRSLISPRKTVRVRGCTLWMKMNFHRSVVTVSSG